eukprot:2329883-Rhodomonas_salina.1
MIGSLSEHCRPRVWARGDHGEADRGAVHPCGGWPGGRRAPRAPLADLLPLPARARQRGVRGGGRRLGRRARGWAPAHDDGGLRAPSFNGAAKVAQCDAAKGKGAIRVTDAFAFFSFRLGGTDLFVREARHRKLVCAAVWPRR